MSKFQLFLLFFFGIMIVAGVLVFSFSHSSSTTTNTHVTIWGDIAAYDFNNFLSDSGLSSSSALQITYVQKPTVSFDADFTEALAEGKGPDLVILSEDMIWKERNKLFTIPYASVSQKDYLSTFADEGTLFLNSTGEYALPLLIDPMVLYYNRDLLSNASLALPPAYWDQMYDYAQKLSIKDSAGNLSQSGIALGTVTNIPHAKDILSLLMLQAGTQIMTADSTGLHSDLENRYTLPTTPAAAALDFYTQFSDPAKPFYSWNRSLLPALTSFTSGDSALYLGFASELREINAKAPTLPVGVTRVPQSRVNNKVITLGRMSAIAVVRSSKDTTGALNAALALTSVTNQPLLAKATGGAPSRRALLAIPPTDANQALFYNTAIQARSWLDPNPDRTKTVFANMIESVTSGRTDTQGAIDAANNQLNVLAQ